MDGGEVELLAELSAAVGAEHVVTHEHQLRTYESDGLLQYAVTPRAVVLLAPWPAVGHYSADEG